MEAQPLRSFRWYAWMTRIFGGLFMILHYVDLTSRDFAIAMFASYWGASTVLDAMHNRENRGNKVK